MSRLDIRGCLRGGKAEVLRRKQRQVTINLRFQRLEAAPHQVLQDPLDTCFAWPLRSRNFMRAPSKDTVHVPFPQSSSVMSLLHSSPHPIGWRKPNSKGCRLPLDIMLIVLSARIFRLISPYWHAIHAVHRFHAVNHTPISIPYEVLSSSSAIGAQNKNVPFPMHMKKI